MTDTFQRVLIISHDVVGRRMAGPGIRAWEMARVLSARQPVTLIAPRPIDLQAPGVLCGEYAWGLPASLVPWLRTADIVVANGFVLRAHPELASTDRPLALDLYDPVPLENLETFRSAPIEQRQAQLDADQDLLTRQLESGDFLLCATERQRDLYIGALLATGGINPALADSDPQLRGLIDVAPFGLPSDPPVRSSTGLREAIPQIEAANPVLLWTGGLWDWLDPLTLVDAMATITRQRPDARLVFLAGRHPGTLPDMQASGRAQARAAELGLLEKNVFFYREWVPYELRANFLLDADIAVSLHHNHLETTYAAVRSRFLDHLWAGLPSIVSAGDAASELVAHYGLGRVAPVGDPIAVAAAALELLNDPDERIGCAGRARALAASMTWERNLRPLVDFCLHPRRKRGQPRRYKEPRMHQPDHAPESYTIQELKQQVAQLHQLWQLQPGSMKSSLPLLGSAKQAASIVTRWYTEPVIEQQQAFNAATVHAIQALADTLERLIGQQPALHQHIADIEQHLLDIDDAQTELARQTSVQRDE